MRDLYKVMKVQPDADDELVRVAYRILARKYHPDHGGDPLLMVALNEAWGVLGDPMQRAAYDETRTGITVPPPAAASAGPYGPNSRKRGWRD